MGIAQTDLWAGVEMHRKPCKGLKLNHSELIFPKCYRRNAQKTLQGIETAPSLCFQSVRRCRNAQKTLQGIETQRLSLDRHVQP